MFKNAVVLLFGLLIGSQPLFSLPKFRSAPRNISEINSELDDYAPSVTADGKTMVFNARQSKEPYQNLYISTFENGQWTKPAPLKVLNSPYNDETPWISADGTLIIFSSDRDGSVEMPADNWKQIKVSGDLYFSRKKGNSWSKPRKVAGDIHTVHHERSPFLSPDGKTLYYTTWPFGNIKRSMLMQASLAGNRFVNPRPLPSSVNTGHQELGLTMTSDGKGAYFSSRRPGGYGGWDLYYMELKDGQWGKAQNMGPEINSRFHELYLQQRGASAYFCSNRPGGKGRYDIFGNTSDRMDELVFRVTDAETGLPIATELDFQAATSLAAQKVNGAIKKNSNDEGLASLKVSSLVSEVKLSINHKGYLPHLQSLENPISMTGKEIQLKLTPIKKDQSFDIHAIHFGYDSDEIDPKSYPFLNSLSAYLAANEEVRFEIIGHTDLHGDDTYNKDLSLRRARSVRDYLVKKGLPEERFRVRGMGKARPLVAGKGKGFDEKNRRTEFRVLQK